CTRSRLKNRPAGRSVACTIGSTMQGGSGLAFTEAVAPAQSGDEALLESLLGPAQLIGAPPATSQDDDWSFQTRAMTHRAASLRTGIDLFRALIFPVRKAR